MNRLLMLAVTGLLAFSLTACGEQGNKPTTADQPAQQAQQPAQPAQPQQPQQPAQ